MPSALSDRVNIYPAAASPENPLFFITSRVPAHVWVCDSPEAVRDYLLCRFARFDDASAALDFEVVDLLRS